MTVPRYTCGDMQSIADRYTPTACEPFVVRYVCGGSGAATTWTWDSTIVSFDETTFTLDGSVI